MKNICMAGACGALLLLSACECERFQCPAFSSNAWQPSGNFRYAATSGEEMTFTVTGSDFSESYGKEETVLTFSCNQNDCASTAHITAISNAQPGIPVLKLQLNLTNNYTGKTFGGTRLRYTLNDMESAMPVSPVQQPGNPETTDTWFADTIATVNTGLILYNDVLIQTRRQGAGTTAPVKTYWHANGQLVGFSLGTGVTYWRQ